jgi:hypothetical protein
MGILRQFAEYLYIKKKDETEPRTKSEGYMHGMNRISLFMFLVALLIMLIRFVLVPLFR